uniref:Uncharacterized protein n=1 Tax=Steinernema glaseri TaxID=37863 RepID=A0A1I8AHY4_9BILA
MARQFTDVIHGPSDDTKHFSVSPSPSSIMIVTRLASQVSSRQSRLLGIFELRIEMNAEGDRAEGTQLNKKDKASTSQEPKKEMVLTKEGIDRIKAFAARTIAQEKAKFEATTKTKVLYGIMPCPSKKRLGVAPTIKKQPTSVKPVRSFISTTSRPSSSSSTRRSSSLPPRGFMMKKLKRFAGRD